jgi:hypothetical protein
MDQREQCLVEAAELAPADVASLAVLVQPSGNMLDELMRDEWHHHSNDEGPCLVTTPADEPIFTRQHKMKEVHCPRSTAG